MSRPKPQLAGEPQQPGPRRFLTHRRTLQPRVEQSARGAGRRRSSSRSRLDQHRQQAVLDRRYCEHLRAREASCSALDQIICHSAAMNRVVERIRSICLQGGVRRPLPVLLKGEAGTGKGFVARAIHYNGPRRASSFIELNCASTPEEALGEILWGGEASAGVRTARTGLLDAAQDGTLFLREIDRLPQQILARLLDFTRTERDGRQNVQIIASSRRDMAFMAESGLFQVDLLVLLSQVTITIPPLRERRADCVELAALILHALAREEGQPPKRLSQEARQRLIEHPWPGNVAQLRNTLERVVLLEDEPIVRAEHLQLRPAGRPPRDLAPAGRPGSRITSVACSGTINGPAAPAADRGPREAETSTPPAAGGGEGVEGRAAPDETIIEIEAGLPGVTLTLGNGES